MVDMAEFFGSFLTARITYCIAWVSLGKRALIKWVVGTRAEVRYYTCLF